MASQLMSWTPGQEVWMLVLVKVSVLSSFMALSLPRVRFCNSKLTVLSSLPRAELTTMALSPLRMDFALAE